MFGKDSFPSLANGEGSCGCFEGGGALIARGDEDSSDKNQWQ